MLRKILFVMQHIFNTHDFKVRLSYLFKVCALLIFTGTFSVTGVLFSPLATQCAHASTLRNDDFVDPLFKTPPSTLLPLLSTAPVYKQADETSGIYSQEMLAIFHEQANSPLDPAWSDLINRLAADGFDRETITGYFSTLGRDSYSPVYMGQKVAELHGVRSEAKRPKIDRSMLLTATRSLRKPTIGECIKFLEKNRHHFRNIENKYGVSRDIVMSVALIETGVGLNLGGESALRVLGGMAATSSTGMLGRAGNKNQVNSIDKTALNKTLTEKSNWAYKELSALLRYAEKNGFDAAKIPSSMYGAVGIGQFMPSNLKKFAVDGDGDGRADMFSPIDAMYSIAKYLHVHGWNPDNSATHNQALYAYNRSDIYVNNVFAVAERIAGGKEGHVALEDSPLKHVPSVHPGMSSSL